MRQGDLVVRRSYGGDIAFSVRNIVGEQALLKGIDVRLLADSPISDLLPADKDWLIKKDDEERRRVRQTIRQIDLFHHNQIEPAARMSSRNAPAYFEVPGMVLHLDGDYNYLRKSISLYNELGVPATGYYVPEPDMSRALTTLLPQVNPDIVVLTGHDGLLKERKEHHIQSLSSYKNSHNFVNAVRTARKYDRSRDSLIIIAGACQSHFEALLQAGANFASSPGRILIHALDPLYIASKVSFTPIKQTVQLADVLQNTLSGLEGVGGVETRGCYRIGIPKLKWKEIKEESTATASAVTRKKARE